MQFIQIIPYLKFKTKKNLFGYESFHLPNREAERQLHDTHSYYKRSRDKDGV